MSIIADKQLFYVNSRRRTSGTSDTDFFYELPISPDKKFNKAVILQMIVPKSYYLVSSPSNTFTLQENASQATVTMPQGNYNRRSFATVLASTLTSSSPSHFNYAVTFANPVSQQDTGQYTITVSGNGTTQPTITFPSSSSLWEPMGFNENSINSFTANTLISTNCVKLQSEDTIYLHSDCCGNHNDDVLQEIFSSTGETSFSNIHWVNQGTVEAYAKDLVLKNANTYHFYLTDEDGKTLNTNGLNIQFTLMLYRENTVYKNVDLLADMLMYSQFKAT